MERGQPAHDEQQQQSHEQTGNHTAEVDPHILSPLLVKEIFKIIRDINRQGVTVLLVEQNAKMALDIANRAYVLETGTIKMEGEATELANNIEVRKAYLGCE